MTDLTLHEGDVSYGPESSVLVTLSDDDIAKLFEEAFDGYCPACQYNEISEGDIVCCDCMMKALRKHWNDGCCEYDIRDRLAGI